ncbi:Uncharacterised protein [uncultured archaeon]|nr:Uncharacterised protein [uncultured archaeon]
MDSKKKQGENNTNSLAVVRADDISKVKTALCDLVRYGRLTFSDKARRLEPAFADNILIHVMKSPLRTCCEAASIVSLEDEASAAIGRLRKIHPPAHVIIVSPRHEIYHELVNYVDILPEIDLMFEPKVEPEAEAQTAEAEYQY